MTRRWLLTVRTTWRSIRPVLFPDTFASRIAEAPAFCLGPSPVQWNALFSQRTSYLVSYFEKLCRRGSPLTQEIRTVLFKLKRARKAAVEEVTQTRIAFERRSVALLNAINISPSGSQILYFGVPTVLGSWGLRGQPLLSQSFARDVEPLRPAATEGTNLWRRLRQEWTVLYRLAALTFLFLPSLLWAPVALYLGWGRHWWVESVRWALERAGPAFIKWGQWGATRPDLLPLDMCRALERLHNRAPEHGFGHTRQEVETSFGMPLEELFDQFEERPVASGSIAQVHRAKLGEVAAAMTDLPVGSWVAVKVRHPDAVSMMQRDFSLMMKMCEISARLLVASGVRLEESVRQFGAPLHEQLDLKLEARNLQRFERNFKRWSSVGFPRPIFPLVSSSVLVESFEDGDLISNLFHKPDLSTGISVSQTGLDLYLKMLMRDNFVHADLHPGNILVQDSPASWSLQTRPKLVLLDAGMVAELSRQDQRHVLTFFDALTRIDGAEVAKTILDMAVHPKCPNPSAFVADMKVLFEGLDFDKIRQETSEIIQEMLNTVRQHDVTIKGSVCTLMATTLVLEGWSTKLNPEICIMDRLRATLPKPWTTRLAESFEMNELDPRMWVV